MHGPQNPSSQRRARARRVGSVLALVFGCASKSTVPASHGVQEPPLAPRAAEPTAVAREIAAQIDPSVDPCTDFFAYACGGWIHRHPVPAGRTAWSVADEMAAADDDELTAILAEPRPGAAWQFHRACLVPENSPAALSPVLAEVDALVDVDDIPRVVGVLARHGVATLFDAELHTDWSAVDRMVFALRPRPERGSYRPEERGPAIRAVVRQLAAAGVAPGGARDVVRFERARGQAVARADDVELRPRALRGRYARWRGLLAGFGAVEDAAVVVFSRGYVDALDRLLRRTPVATVRAWLRWRVADAYARDLGETAHEHASVLAGLGGAGEQPMERAQWCAWQTAAEFPAELGAAFAARMSHPSGLTRAREVVAAVQDVVREVGAAPRVEDPALRQQMAQRIAGLTVRVGHGEPAATPPLLGDHLAQVLALAQARTAEWLSAAGGPPRHDRWESLQFLPTAFHDPVAREVSLGVGILRPPVLRPEAHDALDFGALGAIAGHEMTHALVSGFTYDGAIGWDDPRERALAPAVACLSAPARAGFTPTAAAVEEALADLGGLRFASLAYRRRGVPAGDLAGLRDEQSLYVGYAGFFCASASEADLEAQRQVELVRWRLDVAAAHLPELREAFGCRPPPTPDPCMPW